MRFIYSKIFFWLASILVLSVVLLFLQTKGWLSPVQKVLLFLPSPVVNAGNKIVQPTKNFFKNVYSIRSIIRENVELEDKVSELQSQVVILEGAARENMVLKEELKFTEKSPYVFEPCTILARDPESVTNTLVLNCGEDKGIKIGQAVVSRGYLVGKIFISNSSTSVARLISSPNFSADARISGSEITGLVRGSFGSGITMDLISQNAEVKQRDLVVTAGINELIPKNILVGEVVDIVSGDNDLFKKVTVKNPIDFNDLDYVFVIK